MISEVEVFSKRGASLGQGFVGLEIHLLVFDRAPQALDEHVVFQQPLPSMLISIVWAFRTPVKASDVNCDPWSVLKICGAPKRSRASSRASTQESASRVVASRQERTARVAQSMMATR